MEENLKVDKNYLEAFNLGYELASELNLKTPMFKDLKSENVRIRGINDGMSQCQNEITEEKNMKTMLGNTSVGASSKKFRTNDGGKNLDLFI